MAPKEKKKQMFRRSSEVSSRKMLNVVQVHNKPHEKNKTSQLNSNGNMYVAVYLMDNNRGHKRKEEIMFRRSSEVSSRKILSVVQVHSKPHEKNKTSQLSSNGNMYVAVYLMDNNRGPERKENNLFRGLWAVSSRKS